MVTESDPTVHHSMLPLAAHTIPYAEERRKFYFLPLGFPAKASIDTYQHKEVPQPSQITKTPSGSFGT